jgi:hypothetical protein
MFFQLSYGKLQVVGSLMNKICIKPKLPIARHPHYLCGYKNLGSDTKCDEMRTLSFNEGNLLDGHRVRDKGKATSLGDKIGGR